MFSGAYLEINGEKIELSEKMKWYEYLSVILTAAVLILWSNIPALYETIPILGGMVGGGIAGFAAAMNGYIVKKTKRIWLKILLSIALIVAVVVTEYITIMLFLPLFILIS